MRIVVLGGGGFIGSRVVAELARHGHHVVAVARSGRGLAGISVGVSVVEMDLARALDAADWAGVLDSAELVVNAAGVLRGSDMRRVHVDMPRALQEAAAVAGVRRIVLISAISARADVDSDYAGAKLAGEDLLRGAGVAWTILRPSLVYGDGSYGGTSLMRGMAGLPFVVPLPGDGAFAFTPIHVGDLAHAIRLVCEAERFAGATLEPVGPDTLTLREMLAHYRAWLGFGATRVVRVPMLVMRLIGRLGDIGGGGPIATNSLVQMVAGNAGDSAAFVAAIGFRPRGLDTALAERPAQVQDRWHARLFFLVPAIRAVLVLLWIASAALGFFTGTARSAELVAALGWPPALAEWLRFGSSLLDLAVAALVLADPSARRSTPVQLLVVLGYSLVIGIALPGLWLDPLGPLIKNVPIALLILVHGAIEDRR